jgi:pentatricopeptide repeat protein
VIIFCLISSDAYKLAHYSRLRPSAFFNRQYTKQTITLNASRSSDRAKPSKKYQKSDRPRSDRKTYRTNLELANLTKQNAGRPSVYQVKVALNLLRSMEAPDTVAYNSVLNVFAKLSPVPFEGLSRFSAALQAQQLLQEMEQIYTEQKLAKQKWYDALTENSLDDEALCQGPPAVLVKPNSRSYCTVIDAYARIGNQVAAEKTEQLLHELQQMYESTGDEALRPNLIAYNIVLAAWSKVGGPEAANRCLKLLKEGMPMAPDTISYNSVLHAIALSGEPQAGRRAEELLREMIEKSNYTLVNGRSYTTCMDAWSKTGRPDKAMSLLCEMKTNYKRTNDSSFQPNCVSYATVIHGYGLSRDADKVQKAYRVFREMIDDGVSPNRITYINLLNCCAASDMNLEAIQLVKQLYREALDNNKADHRTFGTVLKACMHHCWEDKDFAVAVFRDACKRGFVSQGVFWQFKQAVPSEIFRNVLGGVDVAHSDLPTEWTRNSGGNLKTTEEDQ